jgi:hypothetical protein
MQPIQFLNWMNTSNFYRQITCEMNIYTNELIGHCVESVDQTSVNVHDKQWNTLYNEIRHSVHKTTWLC